MHVLQQRSGRERHAVSGLPDDEEPGEAAECQGYRYPQTGTASQRHGHWWEILYIHTDYGSIALCVWRLFSLKMTVLCHCKILISTFSHTGDNILTAVSVAKSCGMVGSDEKVIFVNATPHTAHSMPTLKFNLGDIGVAQSSIEVITQVSPTHAWTTLLPTKTVICKLKDYMPPPFISSHCSTRALVSPPFYTVPSCYLSPTTHITTHMPG